MIYCVSAKKTTTTKTTTTTTTKNAVLEMSPACVILIKGVESEKGLSKVTF